MTARLVTLILSDDQMIGGDAEDDPRRTVLRVYTPSGKIVFTYDHHLDVGTLSVDGWHMAMQSPPVVI